VKAALVMMPWAAKHLFSGRARERLESIVELTDRRALENLTDDRAAAALADVDVLLTCWGAAPIDEAALALAPNLRAIVHAAGTVKDFITPAVWDRDVRVTSVAAANAKPVAEYTLAAIIMANKAAFVARERYREERAFPRHRPDDPTPGNMGKRVGIISASKVGRLVIELLQHFDLEVVVSDPFLSADDATAMGAMLTDLDELIASSDVVSLHAPLLPETTGMIDARRLALIKDGATFINTARGAIVDEPALVAELVSGRIIAVIDTTWPEPVAADSPLLTLPNVFLTPHLAGSQGTELVRMANDAMDEIERYAAGQPFLHEIVEADIPLLA
jgi:phosphoglycerate dehydrogenase-like enzyme